MPSLMLVNPSKRRKARKSAPRKTRRVKARRIPNPIAKVRRSVRRHVRRGRVASRRPNPIAARRRRRHNPISMRSLSSGSLMKMLKNAAIGGAGAIGIDYVMAQARRYLPASLQPSATGPGIYDAVVAAATVLLGRGLSKMTKGASEKMAEGALIVQAARLMQPFAANLLPAPSTGTPAIAGLGYSTASRVIPGNARISPMQRGIGMYDGGGSPLLSAYSRGASSLLSSARSREGQVR